MATVDQKNERQKGGEWKISSKAMNMLQCFMDGIDDVVISIALQNAMRRTQGKVVRVEAMDIDFAANKVMDQIRSQEGLLGTSTDQLHTMSECLKTKMDQSR